jgi:KDO2-lipid IV(A) lauroyltransferase
MTRLAADVDALPPPPPEGLRDRATYWRYRALWAAVAALPTGAAEALPDRLGPVWHRAADDAQRERVRAHLARILPQAGRDELDELEREAYASYARYWIESFRLHRMDPADVTRRTTTENLAPLDAALGRGGAVLATAHLGSWDLAALWAGHRGWPLSVVAEVVEPRRLFERFVTLRRNAGLGVVPLVRGGDMLDRMVAVVEGGGLATLLSDRDIGGRGPVVEFFGEPCRLPTGPAAIARRTGCPVAVGAVVGAGRHGWHAVIQGDLLDLADLSVDEGTQLVAHRLEELVRRFPTEWHVFVRQWLVDREPEHPAVAAWRADPAGWARAAGWRDGA